MKYRLKKDLPFAKAGAKVYYDKDNECIGLTNSNIICSVSWQNIDDWIEEDKPREFWVEVRKIDNVATDIYEDDKPDSINMLERYKYIKVREVIE